MSPVEPMAAIIAQHPFWRDFAAEHLPFLDQISALVSFEAGREIFREHEPAHDFYLLRSGRVALQTAAPGRGWITIQTIADGDPLGFSWLYPPYRWHFTARTLEAVELIRFDAEQLRHRITAHAEFGRELVLRVGRVVLQRLQASRLQLIDFYGVAHPAPPANPPK